MTQIIKTEKLHTFASGGANPLPHWRLLGKADYESLMLLAGYCSSYVYHGCTRLDYMAQASCRTG